MTKEEQQKLEALVISFNEFREAAKAEIKKLGTTVVRLTRVNKANRPFMCSNMSCKNRERFVTCPHCGAVIKQDYGQEAKGRDSCRNTQGRRVRK